MSVTFLIRSMLPDIDILQRAFMDDIVTMARLEDIDVEDTLERDVFLLALADEWSSEIMQHGRHHISRLLHAYPAILHTPVERDTNVGDALQQGIQQCLFQQALAWIDEQVLKDSNGVLTCLSL